MMRYETDRKDPRKTEGTGELWLLCLTQDIIGCSDSHNRS